MMSLRTRSFPMACGLVLLLANSASAFALEDDACSNSAVPRTTPSSDFTVIGDGSIVRHETTDLEWQRCSLGQTWDGSTCSGSASSYTWSAALQAAASAGGDWRLPNVNELASIAEECRISPAINRVVFPNTPSSLFWSASPFAGVTGYAWLVSFGTGGDLWDFEGNSRRVRLVRGGQ
ncbi:MAG: Lcl C-terminal domain-containing protein [Wenzhouxiangella sp.]